jgi:hypothetical protein
MAQRCCLALLVASVLIVGCEVNKPNSQPEDAVADTSSLKEYAQKKPDEGWVDGELAIGFEGPVPFVKFSLNIKGLDILIAKAIDWALGKLEYSKGGETFKLQLTKAQLEALKKEGKTSGKLDDGTEFVVENK